MRNDQLSVQSMDFAVSIINLVKSLKAKRETIISNQIGRSGTSIGANIREAQYAHGTADFVAKLQIALKEANETGYWLELLYKTDYISEPDYKKLQFEILTCQQCDDHPCYEACPKKDSAMCIDENGIVYINEENCIGCGLCAKRCKYQPTRIMIDRTSHKAKKCDLCRNRPDGPACIQYCPVKCLGFSDE